jgi:hypothetical protein
MRSVPKGSISPRDPGKITRMTPYENTDRTRCERGDVQLGTWVTMVRTPAVLTLLKTAR